MNILLEEYRKARKILLQHNRRAVRRGEKPVKVPSKPKRIRQESVDRLRDLSDILTKRHKEKAKKEAGKRKEKAKREKAKKKKTRTKTKARKNPKQPKEKIKIVGSGDNLPSRQELEYLAFIDLVYSLQGPGATHTMQVLKNIEMSVTHEEFTKKVSEVSGFYFENMLRAAASYPETSPQHYAAVDDIINMLSIPISSDIQLHSSDLMELNARKIITDTFTGVLYNDTVSDILTRAASDLGASDVIERVTDNEDAMQALFNLVDDKGSFDDSISILEEALYH